MRIVPEPGADGDYFMGVRDPGGNVDGFVDVTAVAATAAGVGESGYESFAIDPPYYADATSVMVCPGANSQASYSATPIANPVPPQGQSHTFAVLVSPQRRGDMDGNGIFNIVDVVAIVNVAFRGSSAPSPPGIADVNSDCIASDIQDVVRIINHVLRGQPQPGP